MPAVITGWRCRRGPRRGRRTGRPPALRRAWPRRALPGSRPMAHPRITGTISGEDPGSGEDPVHPDAPHTPGNPDPPGKRCSRGGRGCGGPSAPPAGRTATADPDGAPRRPRQTTGIVATADADECGNSPGRMGTEQQPLARDPGAATLVGDVRSGMRGPAAEPRSSCPAAIQLPSRGPAAEPGPSRRAGAQPPSRGPAAQPGPSRLAGAQPPSRGARFRRRSGRGSGPWR